MKKHIIPMLLLVALFIALNYASYRGGYKKGENNAIETIIERVDTLTLYDTITRLKPVYLTERVVDSIPYFVQLPATHDTVLVSLPRTEREYGDSTYYAVVAGVEPELKRIDIFQKTQYINNTVYVPTKDTRKNYIELDARFIYDNNPLAPVTLNFGRKLGYLEVYAGGGYDIFQKSFVGQVGGRLQFRY